MPSKAVEVRLDPVDNRRLARLCGALDANLRQIETGLYAAVKTVTQITRSSQTATVTATTHGVTAGNVFRIDGAVQEEYNGEFIALTVADANTITYYVFGSPTSPATGTIKLRKRRVSLARG